MVVQKVGGGGAESEEAEEVKGPRSRRWEGLGIRYVEVAAGKVRGTKDACHAWPPLVATTRPDYQTS